MARRFSSSRISSACSRLPHSAYVRPSAPCNRGLWEDLGNGYVTKKPRKKRTSAQVGAEPELGDEGKVRLRVNPQNYLRQLSDAQKTVAETSYMLDLMLGGWIGRLLLRWQRRIGIPELLLGFATIALVLLFLIVFHLLLMWCLSRMNGRIEL